MINSCDSFPEAGEATFRSPSAGPSNPRIHALADKLLLREQLINEQKKVVPDFAGASSDAGAIAENVSPHLHLQQRALYLHFPHWNNLGASQASSIISVGFIPHKLAFTFSSREAQDPKADHMSSSTNSQPHGASGNDGGGNHSENSPKNEKHSLNIDPGSSTHIPGILKQPNISTKSKTCILPPEKVFPIQIGSELFKLSGASISSDAPSYFSHFFDGQLRHHETGAAVRTLYIDRDPANFRDILKHLQGYHVRPRDGLHFVRLFADAQFYSLPRLISQLFESEIFIQIGDRNFQIPRDVFSSPGDSPNFFSLTFEAFFATPGEVFPGLDRQGLLRPPAIMPPMVLNRSAEVFAELLHFLKGIPFIYGTRNIVQNCYVLQPAPAEHRNRDSTARYPEDGVQLVSDGCSPSRTASPGGASVRYSRPLVDDKSHELIVEIGDENTRLQVKSGMVASNQPFGPNHVPLGKNQVKIWIDSCAAVIPDGEPCIIDWSWVRISPPTIPGSRRTLVSKPLGSEVGNKPCPTNLGEFSDRSNGEFSEVDSKPSNDVAQSRTATGLVFKSGPSPPLFPFSNSDPLRSHDGQTALKRKRDDSMDNRGEWLVQKGQWKLRLEPSDGESGTGRMEIVLVAVKLQVGSGQRARNLSRRFLG
ncbi:hypothetical protein PABG_06142 [Paracoccidioides brasiliensis Pb03]|nr:hypothetical protein PABG_06142 [Paracoccidioides brasiliensis Pb03]